MLLRIVSSVSLVVLALSAVPSLGGEGGAPQPPRVGEIVQISDRKAQGTVTGWVRWNRGAVVTVCVEKIEGEKRNAGDSFDVSVRFRKVEGKDKPQADQREASLLRLFGAGDRVEIAWAVEEERPRVISVKLLGLAPRRGALAGKVVRFDEKEKPEDRQWFDLLVSAPPQGMEFVKDASVRFFIDRINTHDEKQGWHGWIPNPEQVKAFAGLREGDLLEMNFKTDGRFRMESLRNTGHVDVEKRPEGEKKAPEPGKKAKGGDPEPD